MLRLLFLVVVAAVLNLTSAETYTVTVGATRHALAPGLDAHALAGFSARGARRAARARLLGVARRARQRRARFYV